MPFAIQIAPSQSVRQDIGFGQFSALMQLPPLKGSEMAKPIKDMG